MIGVPFILYVVDFFFGLFVRNHLIENVYFERYGEEGVAVSVASLFPLEALQLIHTYMPTRVFLFSPFATPLSYILRIQRGLIPTRPRTFTSCVHGFQSG